LKTVFGIVSIGQPTSAYAPNTIRISQSPAENHKEESFKAGVSTKTGHATKEEDKGILNQIFGLDALGGMTAGISDEPALIAIDKLRPRLATTTANFFQQIPIRFAWFLHSRGILTALAFK
jgi:hypothetical protein